MGLSETQIETLRAALERMEAPDGPRLFDAKQLRSIAERVPALRQAATIARLVHFPRLGHWEGGECFSLSRGGAPGRSAPARPMRKVLKRSPACNVRGVFQPARVWEAIDAIAEGEAIALQVIAELIPERIGKRRSVATVAELAEENADRVEPAIRNKRYPLKASLKAHERINTASTAAELIALGRRKFEICTPEDRKRREAQQAKRQLRKMLAQLSGAVSPDTLAKLSAALQ